MANRVITHGRTGTTEWVIWCGMIQRCRTPTSRGYQKYGGSGIVICDRWRQFENFFKDMGLRPSPDHSIDRIDNNGNYEPSNCRWATRKEQQRNKSNNARLLFQGESLPVSEWAERVGLKADTVFKRLELGWSAERALSTLEIRKSWKKRGAYTAEHRAAMSAGQKRRWAKRREVK